MKASDIPSLRLQSQLISPDEILGPKEAVSHLGALQAQDYRASLWAVGLRCKKGTTKREVEAAYESRRIIRTWLLRGTLHCAASEDIRWVTDQIYPRLWRTATLRDQHLGLSSEIVEKTKLALYEALKGGVRLSRSEVYALFEKTGVPTRNNLGYHMLYRAAWDGLICFGPHKEKEPTFVLLNEWVDEQKTHSNENALKELALRYFRGHGPATIRDYVWWSGIRLSEAKEGIENAGSTLVKEQVNGEEYVMAEGFGNRDPDGDTAYLLPAFDEYIIGYANRDAVLQQYVGNKKTNGGSNLFVHSNGVFLPTLVINGQVVGVWKSKPTRNGTTLTITLFKKLEKIESNCIQHAAERYGVFLEQEVEVKIQN